MEMYKFNLIIDDELQRRASLAGNAAVEPQVSVIAQKAAEAAVEGKTFATPEEKQKAYDQAYAKAHGEALARPEFQKARSEAASAERRRLDETLAARKSLLSGCAVERMHLASAAQWWCKPGLPLASTRKRCRPRPMDLVLRDRSPQRNRPVRHRL